MIGIMTLCETVTMTDELHDIRRATAQIEHAEHQKQLARLELGRAIIRTRDRGVKQSQIARELGITREQVRRLEQAARDADETGQQAS